MTLSLRQTSQWKWQLLRTQILKRDNYLCQPCERQGRITSAHEVDHITPIHKGGTDDLSNLQAICIDCHKDKTQKELGNKRKVSSACDENGYPLSKHHYWNKQST